MIPTGPIVYIGGAVVLVTMVLTRFLPEWVSTLLGVIIGGAMVLNAAYQTRTSGTPRDSESWQWNAYLNGVGGFLIILGVVQVLLSTFDQTRWLAPQPTWAALVAVMFLTIRLCFDAILRRTYTILWDVAAGLTAILIVGWAYIALGELISALVFYRPRLLPLGIIALGLTLLIEGFVLPRIGIGIAQLIRTALIGVWIGVFIIATLGMAVMYDQLAREVARAHSIAGVLGALVVLIAWLGSTERENLPKILLVGICMTMLSIWALGTFFLG